MKNKNKKYTFLLAIGLLGLIAGFVISHFLIYKNMVRFQQNVIGILTQEKAKSFFNEEFLKKPENISFEIYQTWEPDKVFLSVIEEKELVVNYVYALFAPLTEENMNYGKNVLLQYGFTEKGWVYLTKQMGLSQSIFWICISVLPFFGLLIFIFYKKERLHIWEKQELEKQILLLKEAQMEGEYVQKQQKRIQSFIENIAHQIKTPISRVFTSLDIIEAKLEEEAVCTQLEECYGHLESVEILLRRLIDIGRLEAGKVIFRKDLLFLDELLEDTIKSFGEEADRILLSWEQNNIFYGDWDWLKEAFLNVIKNAMEADKSGQNIEVHGVRTEDFFKISIRDHGKGLRERDIPNIFDRFYLPEDIKSNHTGIGLNLAKLIIEGHRGSVYVYNHVEGGAVFQVILPVYESLKVTH